MKLRIQNDHLRFRLSIAELNALAEGDAVSMNTPFCNSSLKTCLMTGTSAPFVRNLDNGIFLAFPYHYYKDLLESENEGFDYEFHFETGSILKISIEKDYKCIGRLEEVNSGLFANPKEMDSVC